MDKLKILVACHKPWKVYQDDIYTPIHVGRAVSKYKDEMADMIGDDTGDHISEKNPLYAEMTAQYWAWKNLHDVEYIGFCHYRRFFDLQLTNESIDNLFRKYTVVFIKEKDKIPIIKDAERWISEEDITIFLMVLKKRYPAYEKAALDYLWSKDWHSRNMLVCKKKLFDQYATWMFDILLECEKYIRPSDYSHRHKIYAYLGELFMPVFFIHHGCRIKNVDYVNSLGMKTGNILQMKKKLKKWMDNIYLYFNAKPKSFEGYYDRNVLEGFKIDNIYPQL